jgi:hypothetical protein
MPGEPAANCGRPANWCSVGASWLGLAKRKACCGDDDVDFVGVSTGEGIAMSNLWINWRFGVRHLQIGPDWPFVTFKVNYWHVVHRPAKWFERC